MESIIENPLVLFVLGLLASGLIGWAKGQVENFTTNVGRVEKKAEKIETQTVEHVADLAGHEARIESLEESRAQIAEALTRLTRIEEWRVLTVQPKLDAIDALDAMPERIAAALYAKLRPVPANDQTSRAANG